MSDETTAPENVLSSQVLRRFCAKALKHLNVRDDVVRHVTESLVETSLRGIDSHGLELLPHYLRAVRAGRINGSPRYEFVRTGPSTGTLDADHTFGHAAGATAMDRCIEWARESGLASIAVRHSTHFGAAGYFALRAARNNMIGMSFTHGDSLMRTPRGTRPYFGTNPIAFAAPCDGEEPFCLDMATSQVTWNKVLLARRRKEAIPQGWAADATGTDTTDPEACSMLYPIGDYKGFGLAMMIEILCGLLTGMPFGRHVSRMYADPIEAKRNLGHFFLAIDISRFQGLSSFRSQLKQMMREVRQEPARSESNPIQVPGDPEKRVARIRSHAGIPISPAVFREYEEIARECGFTWPRPGTARKTAGLAVSRMTAEES